MSTGFVTTIREVMSPSSASLAVAPASEYGVSIVMLIVASPRSRITGGVESDGPKLALPSLTKIATASPITAKSTRSSLLNLPIATPLAPEAASC